MRHAGARSAADPWHQRIRFGHRKRRRRHRVRPAGSRRKTATRSTPRPAPSRPGERPTSRCSTTLGSRIGMSSGPTTVTSRLVPPISNDTSERPPYKLEIAGALSSPPVRPGVVALARHGLGDARAASVVVDDQQRPAIAVGTQVVLGRGTGVADVRVDIGVEQHCRGSPRERCIADHVASDVDRHAIDAAGRVGVFEEVPYRPLARCIGERGNVATRLVRGGLGSPPTISPSACATISASTKTATPALGGVAVDDGASINRPSLGPPL